MAPDPTYMRSQVVMIFQGQHVTEALNAVQLTSQCSQQTKVAATFEDTVFCYQVAREQTHSPCKESSNAAITRISL